MVSLNSVKRKYLLGTESSGAPNMGASQLLSKAFGAEGGLRTISSYHFLDATLQVMLTLEAYQDNPQPAARWAR